MDKQKRRFGLKELVSLAGSLLGFLRYNFEPAKIYLGDTGSMFIGMMMGALAMIGNYTSKNTVGCIVPVIILGVPIFDTFFVMYVRWRRGLHIIAGSPDHFALRLRKWRLSTKQTVITSYLITLLLGIAGLVMIRVDTGYIALWIALSLVVIALCVSYYLKKIDMTL